MKTRGQKGFTLIELLVVISIIGFLSSIVLASVAAARDKANTASALLALHQYKVALNLYYTDHNGSYPTPTPAQINYYTCLGMEIRVSAHGMG